MSVICARNQNCKSSLPVFCLQFVLEGKTTYVVFLIAVYGVVPKWLLTFLGIFIKKSRKLLRNFGASLRETNRQKKILPSKNTVSSTSNVAVYLRNLQIAAFCILYFGNSRALVTGRSLFRRPLSGTVFLPTSDTVAPSHSSKFPLRHSSSILPSPSYLDFLEDLRFFPPHRLLFVCC